MGSPSTFKWYNYFSGSAPGNARVRAYAYHYDDLGRLTMADYAENTGNTGNPQTNYQWDQRGRHTVDNITYDRNGNLKTLRRRNNHTVIDDLDYIYYEGPGSDGGGETGFHKSPNRLQWIEDDSEQPGGDPGNNDGHPAGYTQGAWYYDAFRYDGNGAMTRDANKQLWTIRYHPALSVPSLALWDQTGSKAIEWTYSATGRRLRSRVIASGQAVTTTDYVGALVFENGLLTEVGTGQGRATAYYTTVLPPPDPEFRILPDGTVRAWHEEYAVTDHLGSPRFRFRGGPGGSKVVLQADAYYPYGLRIPGESYVGGSADDRLFNGKRLEEAHSLGWHDYGRRQYDAAIGRWLAVNPADELHPAGEGSKGQSPAIPLESGVSPRVVPYISASLP